MPAGSGLRAWRVVVSPMNDASPNPTDWSDAKLVRYLDGKVSVALYEAERNSSVGVEAWKHLREIVAEVCARLTDHALDRQWRIGPLGPIDPRFAGDANAGP